MKTNMFKKIAFFGLCLVALNAKLSAMQNPKTSLELERYFGQQKLEQRQKLNNQLLDLCHQENKNFSFERFKDLINRGADITICDEDKFNLLHLTALMGHAQACQYLLETEKFDVNTTNPSYKETSLNLASGGGHIDVVDLLLTHGARTDIANIQGHLPLHSAVAKGYANIIDILIKKGKADVNAPLVEDGKSYTPLLLATHNDVIKCLLCNGAKIDTMPSIGTTSNGIPLVRNNPITIAIQKNNMDALKCFVEYGKLSKSDLTDICIVAGICHKKDGINRTAMANYIDQKLKTHGKK